VRFDRDRAEDDGGAKESGVAKLVSGTHAGDDELHPQIGDVVGGKYSIIRVLGAGAMGVVYEARHVRLRQRLAIKVLKSNVGDTQKLLARFEREAQMSAQLRSIHSARVIDVDSLPNGVPYLVMEYLEGRTLDAELAELGRLPTEHAVDITIQVANAMMEAHGLGIIHRDLKPANVFVCHVGERPVIKVLDFGISLAEGDARLTGGGEWLGTPAYVAPEQLRSGSTTDARCDVWSLGVILYELVTGRAPFEGGAIEVIAKVLIDPVPWPVEFRKDLSADLARVIMRALQRDPAERYQSMRAMADALAPFGPVRSATTVVEEIQRARGRLGEILLADGLISQGDLDAALVVQRREGKLLGQVLLEMGFVGHADLLTALAKQQGLPSAQPVRVEPAKMERDATTVAPKGDEIARARERKAPRDLERRWMWPAAVVVLLLLIAAALGMAHVVGTRNASPSTSDTGR
jgi:tRNA A-37 threonylcarbamoyl transferase component Bud32